MFQCPKYLTNAINKRLTRYLTNAQGNIAQLRENESYRKNDDSEGNSYTLIQGQVVGSDGDQYIKSRYYKKNA